MKKRQYIAALACLVAGVIGFVGLYSTEKSEQREKESQVAEAETQESSEDLYQASGIIEPETKIDHEVDEEPQETKPENTENTQNTESTDPVETAGEAQEEQTTPTMEDTVLHFAAEDGIKWPVDGDVILNYSMDSTIYFPTLDQYQYNPAIVIQGNENDKVYLAAKGKIADISTNEVTGLTVTEDLGDGYSAVYGQLKDLNFEVGDSVEAGQVIGYVAAPTKYYSVEGSNLYFQLLKDGQPIDPFEFLE